MKEIAEILTAVSTLADGESAVLATVVDVQGSGYRLPGARMLILADGRTFGTVSGGCLEADVLERAKKVLSSGTPETFTYDTTGDENSVFSLNMGCRGIIDIRLEPVDQSSEVINKMHSAWEERAGSDEFEVPVAVMLFGAGADAVPLVRIASELGWQVTVFDHRPAYLTAERFPAARSLVRVTAEEAPSIEPDARTAAVVMTHNYSRDRLILPALFAADFFYLGLLGPRRRTEQLLDELRDAGEDLTPEKLEKLHAPIGLDIGADTPEAIAVAIIAEIQAALTNRAGGHLRDRAGSIYGRN